MGESKDKNLMRALIMNALLLPGSGHYFIGAKRKGLLMAVATLIFIIAPAIKFVTTFSYALEHQPPPGVSGSLGILAAMGFAWKAHGGFIVISIFTVILLWAYGIADIAIRILRNK
ncbi:MAG: hypothetical protein ABH871_07855 [Pseudomonadota bacterium]